MFRILWDLYHLVENKTRNCTLCARSSLAEIYKFYLAKTPFQLPAIMLVILSKTEGVARAGAAR